MSNHGGFETPFDSAEQLATPWQDNFHSISYSA